MSKGVNFVTSEHNKTAKKIVQQSIAVKKEC